VTELFQEHTRSESTNKVGETSKKVEIPQRGKQILIERLRKGTENEFQKIQERQRHGILEYGTSGRWREILHCGTFDVTRLFSTGKCEL